MQSSFIPANLYNSVYLVVVGFIAYLHYLKIKNLSVFSLQKTKLFSEQPGQSPPLWDTASVCMGMGPGKASRL